jgi:hypothetical protein
MEELPLAALLPQTDIEICAGPKETADKTTPWGWCTADALDLK